MNGLPDVVGCCCCQFLVGGLVCIAGREVAVVNPSFRPFKAHLWQSGLNTPAAPHPKQNTDVIGVLHCNHVCPFSLQFQHTSVLLRLAPAFIASTISAGISSNSSDRDGAKSTSLMSYSNCSTLSPSLHNNSYSLQHRNNWPTVFVRSRHNAFRSGNSIFRRSTSTSSPSSILRSNLIAKASTSWQKSLNDSRARCFRFSIFARTS